MRCTVIQGRIRKYDANAMNNTHGLIKGQECGMEKDRGKKTKEWERRRGHDGKMFMYALMDTLRCPSSTLPRTEELEVHRDALGVKRASPLVRSPRGFF